MFFRRIRDDVMKETGRKQEPTTYESLGGEELYFRRAGNGVVQEQVSLGSNANTVMVPQRIAPTTPERPTLQPAPPATSTGKLTDRLGSEEPKPREDGATPAPAPPPATQPPSQQAEQQQAALPPAAAPSTPAPTAAQPLTPSPGSEATIVAQSAVLYEEQPEAPQRGQAFQGTVTWRTESVSTGSDAAPQTAIKGEVDIPERKMKARVTIRKNVDPALPATHTMEVQFQVPADGPNGGISNVPGALMKHTAQERGAPLQGLSVKVTNGFFLIGFADSPSDQGRNAQLLTERGWIDVPVLFENGRRAIMTLEKGIPGKQAFAEAFRVWK
jgi:hypothetical protein